MNLEALERSRGYVPGAAAKIREKLGLPLVSDADQIANIHARMAWEYTPKDPDRVNIVSDYIRPDFKPHPKKEKKGAR